MSLAFQVISLIKTLGKLLKIKHIHISMFPLTALKELSHLAAAAILSSIQSG